jgi:glycerophosphoryl diester phosphodiesterase
MNTRYFEPSRPRLFGHRGSAAHFPENTLPSFSAAVGAGVPYLEMDVWATADGHIVVHHDETLLRLCGVDRKISEVSLAELKSLDAGYGFSPGGKRHPFRGGGVTIPTLEEVFRAFPDVFCNIEIKQAEPAIEKETVNLVRQLGREESVLLAAEQDVIMTRLRKLCGEIPTSLSFGETAAFFERLENRELSGYVPPGRALQVPETYGSRTLVTPETVAAAHACGLEVHVWTVNDPEDMKRLLKMGVDGLMSDVPEVLVEVAGEISGRRNEGRGTRSEE